MVGSTSGASIKSVLGSGSIRKSPTAPLQLDGSVDSDIVYHEYCHGLTWRMIGSMSGAMSGAIGEGMSDVCAILINNDDVVGEYSASSPGGIRRAPYSNYPNTYGNFGGTSVHADGEIYAAAVWRLKELLGTRTGATDLLFKYLVKGMTYTPAGPYMETMRDGILQAVDALNESTEAVDTCLVWQAFAEQGIGVGAKATPLLNKGKVTYQITQSFTLPSTCQQP
jgi:Zn-dependent metalloprotease